MGDFNIMTKLLNTKKNSDTPIATDTECKARRSVLIAMGAIVPARKADLITKKDGSIILSTRKQSRIKRQRLVDQGIVDENLCELVPHDVSHKSANEGEYKVKPIQSNAAYLRRRQSYFRIMQEILHSRKELKLILGKKNDNDPDWYF